MAFSYIYSFALHHSAFAALDYPTIPSLVHSLLLSYNMYSIAFPIFLPKIFPFFASYHGSSSTFLIYIYISSTVVLPSSSPSPTHFINLFLFMDE